MRWSQRRRYPPSLRRRVAVLAYSVVAETEGAEDAAEGCDDGDGIWWEDLDEYDPDTHVCTMKILCNTSTSTSLSGGSRSASCRLCSS